MGNLYRRADSGGHTGPPLQLRVDFVRRGGPMCPPVAPAHQNRRAGIISISRTAAAVLAVWQRCAFVQQEGEVGQLDCEELLKKDQALLCLLMSSFLYYDKNKTRSKRILPRFLHRRAVYGCDFENTYQNHNPKWPYDQNTRHLHTLKYPFWLPYNEQVHHQRKTFP